MEGFLDLYPVFWLDNLSNSIVLLIRFYIIFFDFTGMIILMLLIFYECCLIADISLWYQMTEQITWLSSGIGLVIMV